MKKILYIPLLLIVVFLSNSSLHARKRDNQWVDTITTSTFTSPGDVAQRHLVETVMAQDEEVSPSYVERLKEAIKRLQTCLVPGACSEQEYIEAVELANHLLDLLLLSTGVLEAREFTERRARAER